MRATDKVKDEGKKEIGRDNERKQAKNMKKKREEPIVAHLNAPGLCLFPFLWVHVCNEGERQSSIDFIDNFLWLIESVISFVIEQHLELKDDETCVSREKLEWMMIFLQA